MEGIRGGRGRAVSGSGLGGVGVWGGRVRERDRQTDRQTGRHRDR